jgi:hypothetical protein
MLVAQSEWKRDGVHRGGSDGEGAMRHREGVGPGPERQGRGASRRAALSKQGHAIL